MTRGTSQRGVTARAIGIGIVFALFFAALTPYNDIKIGATMIAGNQFPVGALFVALLLVGVNALLRGFKKSALTFAPGELLTVWILILVPSGIPSGGMMRFLIPHIVAPHYHSNAVNGWEGKVWADAPGYLKIQDPAAVLAFYEGYPRGQEHVPWAAWLVPLGSWLVLMSLFLVASFCVASLSPRCSSPSRPSRGGFSIRGCAVPSSGRASLSRPPFTASRGCTCSTPRFRTSRSSGTCWTTSPRRRGTR
jgi:hypothetical protein